MATADLDALAAWIQSLPAGQKMSVSGADGPSITREELTEAYNEINEHRKLDEQRADLDDELVRLVELERVLQAYVENHGDVDDELYAIAFPDEVQDVQEADAVAQGVAQLLQQLGVNANGTTGAALLQAIDLIRASAQQPEQGSVEVPVEESVRPVARVLRPAVLPEAAAPKVVRRRGAAARPAGMSDARWSHLHPEPANPPPHQPITADQLLGLPRSANGRYDSGDLQA